MIMYLSKRAAYFPDKFLLKHISRSPSVVKPLLEVKYGTDPSEVLMLSGKNKADFLKELGLLISTMADGKTKNSPHYTKMIESAGEQVTVPLLDLDIDSSKLKVLIDKYKGKETEALKGRFQTPEVPDAPKPAMEIKQPKMTDKFILKPSIKDDNLEQITISKANIPGISYKFTANMIASIKNKPNFPAQAYFLKLFDHFLKSKTDVAIAPSVEKFYPILEKIWNQLEKSQASKVAHSNVNSLSKRSN